MDYPTNPDIQLHNGKFFDGDPVNGIPASIDPAEWMNAITDELLAVIIAAGLTPAEATLTQLRDAISAIAASNAPKSNFTAIVDPAATDDSAEGYSAGSKWLNTATDEVYVCLDAAVGAAVWVKTTLSTDELGSAALKDAGTGPSQVPTNADLGTAAQTDTGTGATQVPTTAQADGRYGRTSTANSWAGDQDVTGNITATGSIRAGA